jgi:hypothetical protein
MKTYRLTARRYNRNKTPKCRWCNKAMPPPAWRWYGEFHSLRCGAAFANCVVQLLDGGGQIAPTVAAGPFDSSWECGFRLLQPEWAARNLEVTS